MMIIRRTFLHGALRLMSQGTDHFPSTGSLLLPQAKRIESLMKDAPLPLDWKYMPAHIGTHFPSVSMTIWKLDGESRLLHPPKDSEVFSDKEALIEKLPKMQEAEAVSLSDDIVVVAEGCDDGNYLPLIVTALTLDSTPRTIRLFLTNGSAGMVQKAAEVGYRALHATGVNTPQVHGDPCNAFDRYPSRIDEFPKSQKIFIPFRLGVVGSYSEIGKVLEQRIPIMGQSGICALCLLMNTEKTRTMLQSEHGKKMIFREGPGYVEGFRLLYPGIIRIIKGLMLPDQLDRALDSLKSNPKGDKGELTFPCITAFSELPAVVKLVEAAGGRVLKEGAIKAPHETITDHRKIIDVCPVWIASAK
ncbi:MAG: hypothetical protein HW387_1795 [Parachlamydiales bacterium]|nr:hypothetical protein [Parachlamydiales bacterium]